MSFLGRRRARASREAGGARPNFISGLAPAGTMEPLRGQPDGEASFCQGSEGLGSSCLYTPGCILSLVELGALSSPESFSGDYLELGGQGGFVLQCLL